MSVVAIILAAGRGRRLGGAIPKQYRPLGGRPLLRRTVVAFTAHGSVDRVRVVIDPAARALYDEAVAGLDLMAPVGGGASRQESVLRGLESLAAAGAPTPERVLIHDGARPFVSSAVIDRVVAALDRSPGAIPALAVNDTLKRGDGERVLGTVARAGLWRAQTPQGFHFEAILEAHRAALGADLSDDAAVAEAAGLEVATVAGEEDNVKVTTADDLARAERLIAGAAGDMRVGSGFDVHRFEVGDHVMLCGVRIAHDAGLAGHSDADCALHAITDAILGAIGGGDIGDHFPPGDGQWADAASDIFLGHAAALVTAAKGIIAHVDVTIICEAPRIAPHRQAMIARVAAILGLAPGRVSVKATTTEGLGFAGRGEGIAAQATATIRLPLAAE